MPAESDRPMVSVIVPHYSDLAGLDREQTRHQRGEVIRLFTVARGEADRSLGLADVAVADQVTEERREPLVHDVRDADLSPLILHE